MSNKFTPFINLDQQSFLDKKGIILVQLKGELMGLIAKTGRIPKNRWFSEPLKIN